MKNVLLTAAAFICIASASIAQTLPAYLPADGLVGWWPFNGNANDESGNGNDGTVNGATLTEDRFGVANAAYDFDGVDDWIEVLDNESIRLSSGTVSAWVNYESSAKMVLLIKQDRENPFLNTSNYGIELNDYGGTLSGPRILGMYTEDCSSNQVSWNSLNSNINLSDGLWHQVTSVYDSSSISLFIDGEFIGTENSDVNFMGACPETELMFGRGWNDFPLWYNGAIDDIAIYNRALSQEEITALFTGEPVNPPTACNPLPSNLQNGLVGYWPFCGNANDESGNGNDGTVNGATLTVDRFGVANAAYDFDGDQDFIVVANEDNFDFQTEFTINAWVK